MARALLARALALALFLAASRPARGALEDDWPTVSAARRAVARVTGAPLRALLCAVSNCRDGGLPTPPGGRYARWGPYDTRLVALTDTDRYGFPDALVACPVAPPPDAADAADVPGGDLLRALLRGVGLSSAPSAPVSPEPRPAAPPVSLPGVAWSHGGSGSCDGTAGFANTADGYSPEMTGDDKGYWLPEALEHLASWGVVAACPSLPGGVPVGDGASTLNAARMLAERQPCRRVGALVREDKLALAGYSLGAGRALRGAAAAANVGASPPVAAVVALHPWGAGAAGPVDAPLLILSATEDTNAPFREARRAFDRATGPKVIAALRGGNHYASPRFWSGATTAFLLAHLAEDPEAEAEIWGARGLAGNPRLTRVDRRCAWWRGSTACA